MKPGYWTLAFASGAYDFFCPLNYTEALADGLKEAKLSVGDLALDAGSGMGSLIPLCRNWLKQGGHLVCMDIDPKGLSATTARANALGVLTSVQVREANFTHSNVFKSAEFDAVLSLFSLYAVSDEGGRLRTLQNFYMTLKIGGRIVLEVPSMDYNAEAILLDSRLRFERSLWQKFNTSLRNFLLLKWLKRLQKNLDAGVFHKFKEDEVKNLLAKVGFKEVAVRRIYGGNALIVTGRK